MNAPTEKQLAYIKKIESVLPDKHFEGTTKQEAFLWIQEYHAKYMEMQQMLFTLSKIYKKNYGGGEDERGFHSVSQGFSGDESDFY